MLRATGYPPEIADFYPRSSRRMSGHHQLFITAEAALKFECTSALNKLRIREEWVIFGPPVLIKLLDATSLAPKSQKHGRNINPFTAKCGQRQISTTYPNFIF